MGVCRYVLTRQRFTNLPPERDPGHFERFGRSNLSIFSLRSRADDSTDVSAVMFYRIAGQISATIFGRLGLLSADEAEALLEF